MQHLHSFVIRHRLSLVKVFPYIEWLDLLRLSIFRPAVIECRIKQCSIYRKDRKNTINRLELIYDVNIIVAFFFSRQVTINSLKKLFEFISAPH
jgi:hypothetical protein